MGAVVNKLYLKEPDELRVISKFKRTVNKIKTYLIEHEILAWILKIVSIAVVVFVIWGVIHTYNSFSNLRNYCEFFYSRVGVEFKRRQNLVPNLVLCMNEYLIHEKGIMKHVSDARQAISGPGDIRTKIEATKQMEGALSKLLGIVEQYPDLKASGPVQTLLKELSNTENRIADWKMKYNENANNFNNLLTSFPTNIIGHAFGIRIPIRYISSNEDLVKVGLINFPGSDGQGQP